MIPESQANRSPAGLLEQVSLSGPSGTYSQLLQAETSTHVTRIHVYNPSDAAVVMLISHARNGVTADATMTIKRESIPAFSVWEFETPSLGATISMARGDTLDADVAALLHFSIYGYGSER